MLQALLRRRKHTINHVRSNDKKTESNPLHARVHRNLVRAHWRPQLTMCSGLMSHSSCLPMLHACLTAIVTILRRHGVYGVHGIARGFLHECGQHSCRHQRPRSGPGATRLLDVFLTYCALLRHCPQSKKGGLSVVTLCSSACASVESVAFFGESLVQSLGRDTRYQNALCFSLAA